MGESQDDTLCRNSTIMKSNILYSQLCRDIIVDIIKSFNICVSSRAFLRDLVETVHVYIQRFCENKSTVLVKRKRIRKKHGAGGREKKGVCVLGLCVFVCVCVCMCLGVCMCVWVCVWMCVWVCGLYEFVYLCVYGDKSFY